MDWIYSVLHKFVKYFLRLLYQPLAWCYDFVAYSVSGGLWVKWIHAALDELPGPRILELGFGTGHLQLALARKGCIVYGIDSSPQMRTITMRRLTKLKLPMRITLGEAETLPYLDQAFNQVVATFPSEYIFRKRTIEEIKRVMKPEGIAVITIQAEFDRRSNIQKLYSWLFKVSGQTIDWNMLWESKYTQPFTDQAMDATIDVKKLETSIVRLIIVRKR